MSKVNGQIVTCDRCGEKVFRACTGEGEADGGFTRWNIFEPLPDGWDLVAIPKSLGAKSGNVYNDYLHVCPKCHAMWDEVVIEGFLKGTPYHPNNQKEQKE